MRHLTKREPRLDTLLLQPHELAPSLFVFGTYHTHRPDQSHGLGCMIYLDTDLIYCTPDPH